MSRTKQDETSRRVSARFPARATGPEGIPASVSPPPRMGLVPRKGLLLARNPGICREGLSPRGASSLPPSPPLPGIHGGICFLGYQDPGKAFWAAGWSFPRKRNPVFSQHCGSFETGGDRVREIFKLTAGDLAKFCYFPNKIFPEQAKAFG